MFGWLFGKKAGRDPNVARNDQVRAALAERGDDGTAPRPIRHFVYPVAGGETNATVVMDLLVSQGLEVSPAAADGGFLAAETREVASGDFDNRTAFLTRALSDLRWTYDGWESALTTDTSAASSPRATDPKGP